MLNLQLFELLLRVRVDGKMGEGLCKKQFQIVVQARLLAIGKTTSVLRQPRQGETRLAEKGTGVSRQGSIPSKSHCQTSICKEPYPSSRQVILETLHDRFNVRVQAED